MKLVKDIKFYNIFLLVMSLLIVFLHIYLRLFLVRKHYTLQEIKSNISYLYIVLCIAFILLHFAIIFYVSYKTYIKDSGKSSSKLANFFAKVFDYIYWKPLVYLHDLIAPDLPYSGYLMLKYIRYFGQSSFIRIQVIAIFFVYIPRLLVVLIFTAELLFYNRIYYVLYCLPLLILVHIYKNFLKFCESFCERNLPLVEVNLVVIPKGSPGPNGIQTAFTFRLNPEIATNDPNFDSLQYFKELIDYWLRFYELRLVTAATKTFLGKYDPYITLLCSSLYCLTGLYKLWYIYFFFNK